MNNRNTLLALFASTAFIGLTGSAFALDGNDVLAKINAVNSAGGMTISAADVATDGSTVTLTDAKIDVKSGPDGGFALGTITMEGVEEADGGYNIERIGFSDINYAKDGNGITATDISMSGVHVPAEAKPGTLDGMIFYDSMHVGPIAITAKNEKVVSIDEANATMNLAEDQSKMDFDFNAAGFNVDLSSVKDPKGMDAIEKLGLQQINGEITMKGEWTLSDGKLDISEYSFDFADVGRLDLNLGITGYTMEFVKALQEATKAAQENPDQAAGQQAMGMAMMGLMQQLSYNGASIRFDDAGITAKLLEYAGSQQGVDGKQMAQSLKGMLPLLIGQLNMPDLQAQIVSAANAYLDDPKSIEVSAKPDQPVPFPQIMGAAMAAPQSLPQVLSVKITANE